MCSSNGSNLWYSDNWRNAYSTVFFCKAHNSKRMTMEIFHYIGQAPTQLIWFSNKYILKSPFYFILSAQNYLEIIFVLLFRVTSKYFQEKNRITILHFLIIFGFSCYDDTAFFENDEFILHWIFLRFRKKIVCQSTICQTELTDEYLK